MKNFVVIILLVAPNVIFAAKILAITPMPSYSHQVVYNAIWRELIARGHGVTLISAYPPEDIKSANLTIINISHFPTQWNEDLAYMVGGTDGSLVAIYKTLVLMLRRLIEQILIMDQVIQLLNDKTITFDLVISEYVLPTFYAFKHRFQCPLIGISSLEPIGECHKTMGNPIHPILYPDALFPFAGELGFYDRITAVWLFLFMSYYDRFLIKPREDERVATHFGQGYPSLAHIANEIDLLLINANPALQPARPTVPGTIYIGGGIHLSKPKPLPKDIQSYLDNAKEGVVYFSLGNSAKSKDIPDKTRQVILDTFRDLPYKVLWKFEDEILEGKPDNVKIMKWIPQQDVLRHPNVKVFITQGGLQSTEEALFNYVPLVVMPIFGDQEMNAKLIISKGFGLRVDHKTLDKTQFTETLMEVIKNPKYRTAAKELAELALDEPMTGLEKAVWWTEYVIRHKGAKHLKGPAVHLPLYQYFFLDIIAFVLAILAVLLLILVLIFKFIKKLLCGRRSDQSNKGKKLKTT